MDLCTGTEPSALDPERCAPSVAWAKMRAMLVTSWRFDTRLRGFVLSAHWTLEGVGRRAGAGDDRGVFEERESFGESHRSEGEGGPVGGPW